MKLRAALWKSGRNTTGIELTPDVLETLGGGKRPRLRVTVNGFGFSVTPGSMNGRTLIPVSAERRAAAGVEGGNIYEFEIELETALPKVDVPVDFAAALDAAGLRTAFDRLAPSHRKEHVRAVEEAKKPETRQRRIEKAVALLES